ncbi:uncharacterized protein DUF4412 [Salegentibacter sp. 24]|jgi:hypothetical protein|uniref:DUF4412 domain-containing protein n=1 Tax=Salegentibacter sp. 24 TaxID=2183986 RepID=UPI0010617E31|nr:DUF4412 domain-containing protein [Salegentibacter sp. 24]TDN95414.1 uncharacterized protein DUF4412 [Salegentibacter sp. 24]
MKKLILLGFSLLFSISTMEAQFLKKLKEKIEKKVEHAVTENISDKAAHEANESLNKMWETNLKNSPIPMGAKRVDISEVPQSYDFDWEYQLNMETSEGTVNMTYLLKEDAPYFGMRMPHAEGVFMILDMERKLSIMYFNSGENNFITASKIDDLTNSAKATGPYENAELKKIGTKDILGFQCQGYETETNEHKFTFYLTQQAPISFANMYTDKKSNIPEGWNTDWLEEGDALMMEMQMIDKNNPNQTANMRCTGLEKRSFSIDKENYTALATAK